MSEAVSALAGAAFDGIAKIQEAPLQGMITVRGDFAAAAFKKAIKSVTDLDVPGARAISHGTKHSVAWMSPDELLVLAPFEEATATAAALAKALGKSHALVADVSDARAMFSVSGTAARDVMAKLFPVDFSAEAFGPGTFRRSHLAQVPAAIWMSDADTFAVVCFRSVAQYAFDALCTAAAEGSEVGLY